jgi:hypothetical protein
VKARWFGQATCYWLEKCQLENGTTSSLGTPVSSLVTNQSNRGRLRSSHISLGISQSHPIPIPSSCCGLFLLGRAGQGGCEAEVHDLVFLELDGMTAPQKPGWTPFCPAFGPCFVRFRPDDEQYSERGVPASAHIEPR